MFADVLESELRAEDSSVGGASYHLSAWHIHVATVCQEAIHPQKTTFLPFELDGEGRLMVPPRDETL
jgi:hypothetical protein